MEKETSSTAPVESVDKASKNPDYYHEQVMAIKEGLMNEEVRRNWF